MSHPDEGLGYPPPFPPPFFISFLSSLSLVPSKVAGAVCNTCWVLVYLETTVITRLMYFTKTWDDAADADVATLMCILSCKNSDFKTIILIYYYSLF